jgi:type I restriction enzyme, S subunit
MGEWKECFFKDAFEIPLRNGLTKPSRVRGSGLKMVNMKQIFAYDRIDDNVDMECVPVNEKERTSLLKYDDLLFARQSLVESGAGKISIFKGNKPTVFESHLIRCRVNNNVAVPEFLYFYWKSPLGKGNISSIVTQTAAAGIKGSDLQTLPIFLPPLPEQKAIASVLSSLDDKIDLLQRQNKTLEAMAETLFRQWFVEEAQGDWEETSLSSIADFLNGLACQKFPADNDIERLPVLKIKELRNGISENSDWATSEVKPEYIVSNGDIIFSWSASLMVKIWDGLPCVLNQHLFKVTSDNYPKWFYYQWCKFYLREFINISASHATTMGHIKRKDLEEAMVLVPSEKEMSEMTAIMTPTINKIINNNTQIRILEKLRDTLLPKLMSGEVRVES